MSAMIEDYALIGDMQSAALISRDGSVDWLCLPRFDSPACFAALLGDGQHGYWRITPSGAGRGVGAGFQASRRYQGDTLILETDWTTPTGTVRVTDFMPPRDGRTPVLVRNVQGLSGSVEMDCEFVVRFGYGQVVPWVRRADGELLAVAGPDALWLATPVQLTGRGFAHRGTFTVEAGQRVPFVLTWMPSHASSCDTVDPQQAQTATRRFWTDWVSQCTYQGTYRDAVVRSLITLKALTYEPTGGIVAAADHLAARGPRRRAQLGLPVLLAARRHASRWRRCSAPATRRRPWPGGTGCCRAVAGDPGDVQIMYGVAGERRLDEWEADWLPGLRELGAGADRQRGRRPSASSTCTARSSTRSRWPARTGLRPRPARLDAAARAARLPGKALGRAGRGNLGGARPAAALRALQGDGLGRLRPGRGQRDRPRPARPGRALAGDPGRDPRTRSARRATTPTAARSPSTTARPSSTPPCCSSRRSASCRPSDPRVVSTVRTIQRELMNDGLVRATAAPPAAAAGRSTACPAARAPSWPAASGWPTRCT